MTDSVDALARELYTVPPRDFVVARDRRAAEVSADDSELASEVRRWRRPSPAAWVVNALVAEGNESIDELTELGGELRDAQSSFDRDALSSLSKQRRTVVAALLRRAVELAEAAGQPLAAAARDQVVATLEAATADAAATDAVRSGRLVRALETIGFEPVDLSGALAGDAAGGGSRAGSSGGAGGSRPVVDLAERRERARSEAAAAASDAAEAVADAEHTLDELLDEAASQRDSADALEKEISELESQLADARDELAGTERGIRSLAKEQDTASRELARARERLERAQAKVSRLD